MSELHVRPMPPNPHSWCTLYPCVSLNIDCPLLFFFDDPFIMVCYLLSIVCSLWKILFLIFCNVFVCMPSTDPCCVHLLKTAKKIFTVCRALTHSIWLLYDVYWYTSVFVTLILVQCNPSLFQIVQSHLIWCYFEKCISCYAFVWFYISVCCGYWHLSAYFFRIIIHRVQQVFLFEKLRLFQVLFSYSLVCADCAICVSVCAWPFVRTHKVCCTFSHAWRVSENWSVIVKSRFSILTVIYAYE